MRYRRGVSTLGPKERRKSSDFCRRRNRCSDVDARTSSGRLFQTAGAAATKARSPIVERCVRRPTSAEVVAERSRCTVNRRRRRGADRPTDRLVPCHGGKLGMFVDEDCVDSRSDVDDLRTRDCLWRGCCSFYSESVALLVARRTNNRKVVGSRPTNTKV